MLPGPTELALILVIVLVLFGAGKLPQVFEAFGQGVKKFREAQLDEPPAPQDVTPKQLGGSPQTGAMADEEKRRVLAEMERREATGGGKLADADEVGPKHA